MTDERANGGPPRKFRISRRATASRSTPRSPNPCENHAQFKCIYPVAEFPFRCRSVVAPHREGTLARGVTA